MRTPWFRVEDAQDTQAVSNCLRKLSSAGISKNGASSYGTGVVQAFGAQVNTARNIITSSGCRIKSERIDAGNAGGQVGGKGPNWAAQEKSVHFEFEPNA